MKSFSENLLGEVLTDILFPERPIHGPDPDMLAQAAAVAQHQRAIAQNILPKLLRGNDDGTEWKPENDSDVFATMVLSANGLIHVNAEAMNEMRGMLVLRQAQRAEQWHMAAG